MHTALYVIWFLCPTLFFLLALWSKLEHIGGRLKRDNPADLLSQGAFVLVCVLISIAIDKTLLPAVADTLAPTVLPLGFYQALLLPFVLVVAAKIYGGSKAILITSNKTPKPKQRNRGRRP